MATKQKAKTPAKGNGKAKGKAATPAPETEKRDNRYLRASRAILAAGESEGLDPIYLAMKADMSQSTAGHCIEAYKGVCAALREFKLLPVKRAPAKAPTAPEKAAVAAQKAEEPVPA
jgi:hypothetical protein